jgi:pyruvyltransferase
MRDFSPVDVPSLSGLVIPVSSSLLGLRPNYARSPPYTLEAVSSPPGVPQGNGMTNAVLTKGGRLLRESVLRSTEMRRTGPVSRGIRWLTRRPPNQLPIYWFRGTTNFGDLISPVILAAIFDVEPVWVSKKYRPKVLGAGSILAAAKAGDVVWGSGLLAPEPFNGRGVRFLAVRGPRTRSLIEGDVPERYGDPGILIPTVYQPSRPERRYDVGLVPHYRDTDLMTSDDPSVRVIHVKDPDWRATVDQINQCDVIISSSLHGLIVAEAYGIPAVWVQPTDRLRGGRFKFLDYYEGSGRTPHMADWSKGLLAVASAAEPPPRLDPGALLEDLDLGRARATGPRETSMPQGHSE